MLRRQVLLHAALAGLVLAACAARQRSGDAQACAASLAGAAPGDALQDCLDRLPDGAVLALAPGRIVITRPLVLRHSVTITTAGLPPGAPRCGDAGEGCAVLDLRLAQPGGFGEHAVSIRGPGTVLDHLVVEGGRADPARNDRAACNGSRRASMGGLDVSAEDVTIRDSVLRDAACYSAAVVDAGVARFRFTGNAVLSNGTHDSHAMWADGLTVLDGVDDVITGNLFRDNTDVQLVLGGCRGCTVADNRVETTADLAAAAFAGILLHAWPQTSGDYAGSRITGNAIDCGPAHGCGFGLGVGGRAWYRSPTQGGLVAGNSVRRAGIGINVDDATGPVTMRANQVTESGGTVRSHCGATLAGPVNISPASRRYVDATVRRSHAG